jgi:hypothetical protein
MVKTQYIKAATKSSKLEVIYKKQKVDKPKHLEIVENIVLGAGKNNIIKSNIPIILKGSKPVIIKIK